jgi:hypothetical protein
MADESKFLQLSLTPGVALHKPDTRINGMSLGIWNENPQSGFSLGVVNGSTGESSGFSLGVVNYTDTYRGYHWGVVNFSKTLFSGWQNGCVNMAREIHGLQTGVVNYAETLNGVQIGLVCLAYNNPWFSEFPSKLAKGFVFANWSF